MEKREPSYTIGRNVNWCNHYGNNMEVPQKIKNKKLLYDTATTLLGTCLDKTLIRKDACAPMFTAALFPIAKIYKQAKCPSTEEWIKMMWCIYTTEYHSAFKRMK